MQLAKLFFDIVGPDSVLPRDFYSPVFAWDITGDGKFPHTREWLLKDIIREDPQQKRVYPGVPDIKLAMAAIQE